MPRVWLVHLDPPLMLPDGRDRWPTGIRNSTTVSAAFVLSDTQTIGDRVEDAQVGLVRHDERDILKAHAGPLGHLERHVSHRAHRDLEQLRPLHLDRVAGRAPHLLVERGAHAGGSHREHVPVLARRAQQAREHSARPRLGNHHRRPGAVAEQHGDRAIVPVDHGRKRVDADHQHARVLAHAFALSATLSA
jgi:hypothetical protein